MNINYKNNDLVPVKLDKIRFFETLSKSEFKMAEYQRPFTWGPENILNIAEDIMRSHSEGKEYNIANLLAYMLSPTCFELGDGQQRSTSLFVIMWSLLNTMTHRCNESLDSESIKLIEKCLGKNDDDGLLHIVDDEGMKKPRLQLVYLSGDHGEDKFLKEFANQDYDLNTLLEEMVQISTDDEFEEFVMQCKAIKGDTPFHKFAKTIINVVDYWTKRLTTNDDFLKAFRALNEASVMHVDIKETRNDMARTFGRINQSAVPLSEVENAKAAVYGVLDDDALRTQAMQQDNILSQDELFNEKAFGQSPKSCSEMKQLDTVGERAYYHVAQALSSDGKITTSLDKCTPEIMKNLLKDISEEELQKLRARGFIVSAYMYLDTNDGLAESRHGIFAGMQKLLGRNNKNVGAVNFLLNECFRKEEDLIKAVKILYVYAAGMDLYHVIYNGESMGKSNVVIDLLVGKNSPLRKKSTVKQFQNEIKKYFGHELTQVLEFEENPRKWDRFDNEDRNRFNSSLAGYLFMLHSLKTNTHYSPTGYENFHPIVINRTPHTIEDVYFGNNNDRRIARSKLGGQLLINSNPQESLQRIPNGGQNNSWGVANVIKHDYPNNWNTTFSPLIQGLVRKGQELSLEQVKEIDDRAWRHMLDLLRSAHKTVITPSIEQMIMAHYGANTKMVYRLDDALIDVTLTEDLQLKWGGENKVTSIESLPGGHVLNDLLSTNMSKYLIPYDDKKAAPDIIKSLNKTSKKTEWNNTKRWNSSKRMQ